MAMVFEAEVFLKFKAVDYETAKQILGRMAESLEKEFKVKVEVSDTWEVWRPEETAEDIALA